MEYHIVLHQQRVDVDRMAQALSEQDAGAVVDQDGDMLRVSCYLRGDELLELLRAGGLTLSMKDVKLLPSICCGGCSG